MSGGRIRFAQSAAERAMGRRGYMGDDRNVPRATTHASLNQTPTFAAPVTTPPLTSASRDPSTSSDSVARLGFHGERGRASAGSIVQLNAQLAQRNPVL
jgi:hypothetical protein